MSASGEYLIFGGKPFAVDPARKYRVKGSSHANAAGLLSLFGLVFFDASKAFITNRYGESSGGALFSSAAGWTDFEALFLQSGNTGQGDIPPNAVFAQPFCLSNYTSAAGKIAAVDYLYGEDISQQVAVTSQAGIATSQASSASSSAALAQSSAVTSAAFSSSLNNKNAQFANWSAAAPALPNDWVYGVNNEGQTVAKVAGEVAGYAIDLTTPGSRNWEIYTTTPISSVRAGWYVMELDIDHVSGNWGGAGMRLVTYDASSNYLGVQTILVSLDKESSAQTILSATPTAGRYKFRKIVNITNALTSFVNVAAYGPGFGGGNANPGRVVFRKCGFRLATETEIRDQTVLLPMQSTVAVHTGALATLQGENTAYFQVEGNAGSDAAFFISARARASYGNAPSSSVSMGAREFHVYNQVAGSWRKAMSVVEGNAIFTGGLQAGTFIRLGGGDGWPVALRAKDYTVADGTTVSFGLDLGALPLLDFNPSGLAALAAGEAYQLYADGFTGTGFIARLKIATSGAATTYTLDADTAQGTGPTRQIDKASNPDANTGNYAFNVQGSATTLNYYEPEFQSYISGYGTVYVDIWVKKAGVWLKAAYASVFVEGNGSGVSSTSNWYLNETYQLGTGVQAFGVSVNSFDGSTSAASVQDLQSVMWTTTSVSGSRTATPSGQLGKVTVRPQ